MYKHSRLVQIRQCADPCHVSWLTSLAGTLWWKPKAQFYSLLRNAWMGVGVMPEALQAHTHTWGHRWRNAHARCYSRNHTWSHLLYVEGPSVTTAVVSCVWSAGRSENTTMRRNLHIWIKHWVLTRLGCVNSSSLRIMFKMLVVQVSLEFVHSTDWNYDFSAQISKL